MSRALKDWAEQEREQICDDLANGFLGYEEAEAKLRRLGFDIPEIREMLGQLIQTVGSGSMK